MEKIFKETARLHEFDRDLKKLAKRFRTLEEDLVIFIGKQLNLYHKLNIDNGGIFQIPGLPIENSDIKIYKAKKFACRALKGRGSDSGIRVIYSYAPKADKITLIEVYFKSDKENEDKERIMGYIRCNQKEENIPPLVALAIFCLFSVQSLSWSLPAKDVMPIPAREYFAQVHPLLQQAQKSIRLIIYEIRYYPRFKNSSTNQLIQSLIDAHQRGVSVEVIVEESSEHARDNAAENREAVALLEKVGISVYFDSPATTTHDKVLVIDERYVVIGSTNWSYHALEKNNESSVLIDSPELARYYVEYFERLKANTES